jgi:hypothetical protein
MVFRGSIDMSNKRATAQRSLDQPARTSKGTTMLSIIVLIGGTAAAALIGSLVVTARDGYRRQPRETFARTV